MSMTTIPSGTGLLREADRFAWEPQPRAAAAVAAIGRRILDGSALARRIEESMARLTGTRWADWVDFYAVPQDEDWIGECAAGGFRAEDGAWRHPAAIFPAVVPGNSLEGACWEAGIRVESVEAFLKANGLQPLEDAGVSGGRWRKALVDDNGVRVSVVERRGYSGVAGVETTDSELERARFHLSRFRERPRSGEEREQFAVCEALVDASIADLGVDWSCDLFFQAEREYWESRNRAAQVQKMRQDRLGLGWANHDHHTYRSSRAWFPSLIGVLEKLGMRCRERFYAGREAGWGAQVLEQPVTGIVVFADVDMSPEELQGDFAHGGFPGQRSDLGTVGLWCALHGEAFLQAGMHHLECQFDFAALREQLAGEGIGMMPPFTNFPFLTQCFTEGERWPVEASRVQRLVDRGLLTPGQGQRFLDEGAIGSHLENLERNDGYKGFNQTGVSDIISRTDPRRL
jgi:hypothetical protein